MILDWSTRNAIQSIFDPIVPVILTDIVHVWLEWLEIKLDGGKEMNENKKISASDKKRKTKEFFIINGRI
jgi:hypothetical protein